ncbi:MAG: rhodanese-like domain-containing protein [Candidatus Nanopelagicales bacterium]
MTGNETAPPPVSRSIDERLTEARQRIRRYSPAEAHSAAQSGALIVDIRPQAQRQEFGEVPGALVLERNVLEWRLDPRSDSRLADVARYDLEVIVLCQEGYTSSLAADSLRELGIAQTGDIDGGFVAWKASGLPTTGNAH